MKGIKNSRQGFTLLELLVVVLIIGILASIALPQYKKAVYKSRYNSLMALVNSMYQAEERYFMANGDYTNDLTNLDIDLSGCTLSNNKKSCTFDWGSCNVSVVDPDSLSYIGSKVACTRSEGLQNSYAYYFRVNQLPREKMRTCTAKGYDKNNIWNQICKDAGANFYSETNSSALGGEANAYIF